MQDVLYLDVMRNNLTPVEQIPPFINLVQYEIQRIDSDLELLYKGELCQRNKQRKKRRLLAKKEKMKVRIQMAMRGAEDEDLSPYERRTLDYYSRKLEPKKETDPEFLYRVLCVELGLTLEDWEPYFP